MWVRYQTTIMCSRYEKNQNKNPVLYPESLYANLMNGMRDFLVGFLDLCRGDITAEQATIVESTGLWRKLKQMHWISDF